MVRLAKAFSACISLTVAVAVPARAQNIASRPSYTPESAMAFLVKSLPGLKEVDTWNGGWLEAKLDGADSKKRCELITKAPFGLIHYGESTRELDRQTWELDFARVSGVGQQGSRMLYKLKKTDQVFSYDAGTPELALQIAYAFDALRQECSSVQSVKS
jgi:hypothetical protein